MHCNHSVYTNRAEYVKGGAAPLFLMGQVFEVFFEVFSLFCRIILDYVRTQIRARFLSVLIFKAFVYATNKIRWFF